MFFFFQAEDGIRDADVTGVQTCALPIFHGGTKRNIIPDQVQLLLTVRTYKPEVRKRVLDGIARVARGVAITNGVPDDRMPLFELLKGESIGATYNDPALTERLASAVSKEI